MKKLVIVIVLLSFVFCGVGNAVGATALQNAIAKSQKHLLKLQYPDGHWEGKIHINPRETAYYILTAQYIGIADKEHTRRSANWLITHQHTDGSWGFFDEGGEGDISVTGIVALALEAAGVPRKSRTLIKAREYIHTHGGPGAFDLFCKIFYVLYNKMSWDEKGIILPPIESMLLAKDADQSINKMNAWIREGTVPAMVLKTLDKKKLTAAEQSALKAAEFFIVSHQLEDGCWYTQLPTSLSMIALYRLNWEKHKPRIMVSLEWLHKKQNPDGYQRRFELSVWDTALAVVAFKESGASPVSKALLRAADWLINAQTVAGGELWSDNFSGGWSYNPYNIIYPDNDDTALALMALSRTTMKSYTKEYKKKVAMERGKRWLLYMQNDDGGWATFARNQSEKTYKVPPTAIEDTSVPDITGHVLSALGKLGYKSDSPSIKRAIEYLKKDQTEEGAWYGRWGLCYLYGTSTVLIGLNDVKEDMNQFYVRKAVAWLKKNQNKDGGWGEEFDHWSERLGVSYTKMGKSTVEQTAWVIMALLAAGEDPSSPPVEKGIRYILKCQRKDGSWLTKKYTVLGLNPYRNTLYPDYWPLMALGMYSQYKHDISRIQGQDHLLNSIFWPHSLETYSSVIKKMPVPNLTSSFKEEIEIEAKGRAELEVTITRLNTGKQSGLELVVSNIGTDVAQDLSFQVGNDGKINIVGSLEAGHSHVANLKLEKLAKGKPHLFLNFKFSYKNSEGRIISETRQAPVKDFSQKSGRGNNNLWILIVVLVLAAVFFVWKKFPEYKLVGFALGNLKKNTLRTALSMLGMIVGVAAISGTISLGLSFQDRLASDFKSFGAGRILVLPYELQVQAGPPQEIIGASPPAKFNEEDLKLLRKIDNIESVCAVINAEETVEFAGKKAKLYITFLDTETFYKTTPLKLASGRFISAGDRYAVNLGSSIVQDAFPEEIEDGMQIKIGSKNYRVVGSFKDVGGIPGKLQTLVTPNILVYAPLSIAGEFTAQDYYDGVEIKVKDESKIMQTSKDIEEKLKINHQQEVFSTLYTQKLQDKVANLLVQFNLIIIVIGAFSLLVSGIGIMNIMLVSVTERKREIGILKALGAKESTILKIFLLEAGSIGLISGIIGCALGYLVLMGLQAIAGISAPFNPLLLLVLSLTFALVVGIVSGTYPAYRASKLDPIEAIKHE